MSQVAVVHCYKYVLCVISSSCSTTRKETQLLTGKSFGPTSVHPPTELRQRTNHFFPQTNRLNIRRTCLHLCPYNKRQPVRKATGFFTSVRSMWSGQVVWDVGCGIYDSKKPLSCHKRSAAYAKNDARNVKSDLPICQTRRPDAPPAPACLIRKPLYDIILTNQI